MDEADRDLWKNDHPICPRRVTEKGNYSEPDAAKLIRQILDGVAYLHAQGKGPAAAGRRHLSLVRRTVRELCMHSAQGLCTAI